MSGMVIKGISSVSERILEQINRYTRRRMEAGEVYTFSVALCDNEVDRDLERFSIPALEKLKELFLGKTGIFDHAPKSAKTKRLEFLPPVWKWTRAQNHGGRTLHAAGGQGLFAPK